MRIAVLSTLASGGAASAAWRLTRALTNFGHECSFFVLEGSGKPLRIPLLNNDTDFLLPILFRRWGALTKPESLVLNAVELFSDTVTALNTSLPLPTAITEAEIIHLHWVAGMIFSPALLNALTGKKVVWTLHDENAFTGGCHYSGECRNYQTECRNCPLLKQSGSDDTSARCFRLKEQLYPSLTPFIITPSAWLAERVKASALLAKYPVKNITNPLDLKCFTPPQSRIALRKKLGLPEDIFVILTGSESLDNQRKNTKAIFDALALLAEESPNLPIVVMTYGYGQPYEFTFPVRHFGYVDNEEIMAELYGAADLFVNTSLQENLSLALCEAQACGTPTLCFNVGGNPETMLPEKTGFIAAEPTYQSLAERLRRIIADRSNLTEMRKAARSFAEERFDPAAVAAAYTEVYKNAQIAPGLELNTTLYADLVQNQIASLASFLHDAHKEQKGHLQQQATELNALRTNLATDLNALRTELNALRTELNTLRWSLKHPLRWFFRKLRAKLAHKDTL